MKKIAVLATALLFAFTGCASLQKDIFISAEDTINSERVTELELQIASFDSPFYLNGKKLSKEDAASVDFIKNEIDFELSQPHLDKVVESRLLSLKGRCAWLQNKKGEASKCCANAKKKYENDIQLLILQRRLEQVDDISIYRVKLDSEALAIEDALVHFEKGEFDIAAGLFDSVFVNQETIYREPYASLRAKAWELRNIDSSNTSIDWSMDSFTVLQMMNLANTKNGLLDYYTAGNKYEGKKLYTLLSRSGLANSVSGSTAPITEKTSVTRIIAARFLWNLYSAKNSITPTKYSTKYRSRENAKSPVADITLDNPDFDAVLGTVEYEIMTLADGKNFEPTKSFSAADFDSCLNKIK